MRKLKTTPMAVAWLNVRLGVGALVAAFALTGLTIAAETQSVIYRFDIPSQNLNDALQAMAYTSQHKLLYISKVVDGRMSPELKGEFTIEEAVGRLLDGTELTYQITKDGLVAIQSKKELKVAASVQSDNLNASQADTSENPQNTEKTDTSSDPQKDLKKMMIEEVIVTAQRREENLQDVPISISALAGDQLDTSSLSVNQELARVPGVAVIDGTFGASLMTIRGVTATNPFLAGASTLGYYLDTVPFGFVRRAFTPNASAFDLERVEVLRGPQGTLYGASSQSGVVRVLTHPAELDQFDLKFRTYVSMTEDGGTNSRGDVAVNVPLVQDRLGVRVVYGREDLSGWIDRPSAGERDINSGEITNGRIRIDASPTDRLTLSAMYWHNEESYRGINTAHDDRTTAVGRHEPSDSSYDIYSFNASYDFGSFVFTSATSHIDYVLSAISNGFGGNIGLTQYFPSEVFAEELSLASTGEGPWRWSIGAIHRDAEDIVGQNVFCGSTPCFLPNPAGIMSRDRSKSYAVFGEVTRSLTEELDLTVGLRYFEDEMTYNELSNGFDPNAVLMNRTDTFDATTPRVVLTWQPTDDFTTYASYAQGFRSGFGPGGTALAVNPDLSPTAPDTLTSYEVGAKGNIWGDLVSYEVAAYYQQWDDVQQFVIVPFLTSGISHVINGPSASGPGVDWGFTWRPLRNLSLAATYSWNDLTFDSEVVSGNPPNVIARSGDRLTDSPEYTAGLSGEYQFSLGGGYEANVSAGVSQVSQRIARVVDAGNTTEIRGDDVTTVSARFAVDSPFGWTISLFGENLNDFNGTPTPSLLTPAAGTNRIRPMTVGLQFEYRLK